MDVSVIIINFNTKQLTSEAIESVFGKTRNISYEIIVVDNNSSDDSYMYLYQKFGTKIKLVKCDSNIGFGRANNLAIKQAKSKYVFLLNSDTLLINNAIEIFFNYMEENDDIAVCGGSLYNLDMTPQISYGNFPTIKQVLFEEFQLYKIFKKYYNKNLSVGCCVKSSNAREVDYISGADMFIRKTVLNQIGIFDTDFFLYYEETELNYRIWKNGYKTMLIPDARIFHLCGESIGKELNMKSFNIKQTSKFLFFQKAYGRRTENFLRIILNISYSLKYLCSLNNKYLTWIQINRQIGRESNAKKGDHSTCDS